MPEPAARAILQLRRGGGTAGPERLALLSAIRDHGSITAAAKATGLSYRGAWQVVQALNTLFERPLVESHVGGANGGTAALTSAGEAVLTAYGAIAGELAQLMTRLDERLAGGDSAAAILWRLSMKTSARNAFRGIVRTISEGAVNSEVILDIGGDLRIVAVITRDSVTDLGLEPGVPAIALIKSSFVLRARGDAPPRTSARNCLTGTVARHEEGAVNDEVVLDLGGGRAITAVVTRESGAELGFAIGARAHALVKASHVILAVD